MDIGFEMAGGMGPPIIEYIMGNFSGSASGSLWYNSGTLPGWNLVNDSLALTGTPPSGDDYRHGFTYEVYTDADYARLDPGVIEIDMPTYKQLMLELQGGIAQPFTSVLHIGDISYTTYGDPAGSSAQYLQATIEITDAEYDASSTVAINRWYPFDFTHFGESDDIGLFETNFSPIMPGYEDVGWTYEQDAPQTDSGAFWANSVFITTWNFTGYGSARMWRNGVPLTSVHKDTNPASLVDQVIDTTRKWTGSAPLTTRDELTKDVFNEEWGTDVPFGPYDVSATNPANAIPDALFIYMGDYYMPTDAIVSVEHGPQYFGLYRGTPTDADVQRITGQLLG